MRIFLLLVCAGLASAAILHTVKEPIPGKYIVKLKSGENVESLITKLGRPKIFHKYSAVFPGFAATMTERMLKIALASDAVEYVEEDGVVRADSVASWGLDRIDQLALPLDDVYDPIGSAGSGVNIYVIDTGINLGHIDYTGRISSGFDYGGGDGNDCNGHGSHCAGTVAGTNYGVAKQGHLNAVRVLNCFGSGSTADIVAGCDWVADNAVRPAAASMSLGGSGNHAMDDAVRGIINANVSISVSGGNDDFSACNKSPARTLEAITVGATDITDTRASFSNFGPCIDIFAPGVDITSAWDGASDAINTISGTSMATPHVAGAAAILLGNDSSLTPAMVKEMIQLKSINGAVTDTQEAPNLLLYMGEGSGSGYIPDPDLRPALPTPFVCHGEFSDPYGSFSSPNYPSQYANDLNCDYLIWHPYDGNVYLNVVDFELESSATCGYDSLTIYDGPDDSAPLIGTYCGTEGPPDITSTGSSLFLQFESDVSITRRGFQANYTLLNEFECGTVFTDETGTMNSPNWPEKYDDNVDCTWTITGEANKITTISFMDFDVEQHTDCTYDSLEIYDGDSDQGNLLAKLCGSEIPADVRSSTGSGLYIRFITDFSVSRTGFSLMFKVE